MEQVLEGLMVLIILTNLALLGSSRLGAHITTVAIQGFTVGLLPLCLFFPHGLTLRLALLAAVTIPLRSIIFPWLVLRAVRQANVRREVDPFVGYPVSILAGVLSLVIAFWMNSHLSFPSYIPDHMILPVAFSTILVGLFLIISRKLAINQVIGYLVMENGIYILGITFAEQIHFLVELGVLLDIFVAIFVMSIAVYRISQQFDHIDAHQLMNLREC